MKVDKETVQKMAHLSRLEITDSEAEQIQHSMSQILDWMDKLNELDTTGVEPLIHLSEEVNVLRKDEVQPPLPHDKGLANAPKHDSDYFRVPKVIE